tara:strand:+ start:5593 stop:7041 length:1449 start_codon:yes stop_codon:yes gene_type:complete
MFIWIVIVGGISSFIAAMGIGSNDAANAFATSVGSKALTIKQASILAVVFETSGAVLMGSHVTDTIRKGIANYQCFENEPYLLMYGCMWVIISVSGWLFLASYLEMPVSTTHSCVGGMIGMTIATVGSECVIWFKQIETFPYIGGVGGIIMSWFLSPIFSGIISSIVYGLTRKFVLRHNYESKRLNYIYPILVGTTLLINSFFIIYKGAKGLGLHRIEAAEAIGWSFLISSVGAIITIPLVKKIRKKSEKTTIEINNNNIILDDITNNKNELTRVTQIHENAEKFDERTEEVFKYLQIFSAICDSFSHGANDVANAIGPFAAIYLINKESGNLSKKLDMDNDAYWILAIGGIGISFGLILYGKNIINAIGTKLCKITPSRGTCIELSSAMVIIIGSRLKIPLSTTHCQVGATVGVGLLENKSCNKNIQGINHRILIKTTFGWIITCVIVGITAGLFTAQGIYSPIKSNIIEYTNNTFIYNIN